MLRCIRLGIAKVWRLVDDDLGFSERRLVVVVLLQPAGEPQPVTDVLGLGLDRRAQLVDSDVELTHPLQHALQLPFSVLDVAAAGSQVLRDQLVERAPRLF